MSYCSIEEAWGAPFEGSTPQPKHTLSKSKRRRRKERQHEGFANPPSHDEYSSPPTAVWGKNHWEAPDVLNPDAHTRDFSRNMPSGQVPNAIEVSLQGAPFQAEEINETAHQMVNPVISEVTPVEEESKAKSNRTESQDDTTSTKTSPVIHEELDWMRNHLTHLTDRIEALTTKIDDQTKTRIETTTPQSGTYDTVLYVITGAFTLVLLDVMFRAGARSVPS